MHPLDLTVSIVLYKNPVEEITGLLSILLQSGLRLKIYLIDNSETDVLKCTKIDERIEYIFNSKNIGYGRSHNIAIEKSFEEAAYHLILNSDTVFEPSILIEAFEFMENNKNVALLTPLIFYKNGALQYMCRMLPTPFDLIVRRFAPNFLKSLFRKRLDNYLLKSSGYNKIMNIPNLQGSFMFTRTNCLKAIGGFDEKFFMYVEDIDLVRRLHKNYQTLFYPHIKITHSFKQESSRINRLLFYHIKSAIYYFNKWGWFFDKERRMINLKVKEYLK
jgi:GT2 family glycosyltransferase